MQDSVSTLLLIFVLILWFYCSGIIEQIKSGIKDPKLGLGKQEEDDFFTAEENIQRQKLDIEVEETEEQAKKREVCILDFDHLIDVLTT